MQPGAPVCKVAHKSACRRTSGPSSLIMATKTSRLRRTRDIRSVFTAGRPAHGRAMVLHARRRGDAQPARWTTVAGRKVGGSVQRNRAKRRLRAVVTSAALPAGHDLVVVARAAVLDRPFTDLREEFSALVGRVRCPEEGEGRDGR